MKPTYQHKIIGQYLQITYSQVRNWPFHSAEHLADELCSRDVALVAGQFLVIGMDQDGIHCGAIDGLAGDPSPVSVPVFMRELGNKSLRGVS